MSGSNRQAPITPAHFPLMRATRVNTAAFDAAIEQIADGIATGAIRNTAYLGAKDRLSRAMYDAWQKHVLSPHFHGRGDEIPRDLRELYWSFSVTNLHEVISASKKVGRTEVQGAEVDAMRALLNEALPLALAVAELKAKVVKGRAPPSGPAKPVNPNKVVRTCPVCFRQIAVVGGHMAHHGYERPGIGFQTASCPGTRFQPWEISNEGLVWWVGHLRKNLERDEQAYQNRDTLPLFLFGRRERDKPKEQINRDDPLWPSLFKDHLSHLVQRIEVSRQEIPKLEVILSTWKPAKKS